MLPSSPCLVSPAWPGSEKDAWKLERCNWKGVSLSKSYLPHALSLIRIWRSHWLGAAFYESQVVIHSRVILPIQNLSQAGPKLPMQRWSNEKLWNFIKFALGSKFYLFYASWKVVRHYEFIALSPAQAEILKTFSFQWGQSWSDQGDLDEPAINKHSVKP